MVNVLKFRTLYIINVGYQGRVVQQTIWPWIKNIERKTHSVTSVRYENNFYIVQKIDAKFRRNTMFLCNNSDQTHLFNALTFVRSLVKC